MVRVLDHATAAANGPLPNARDGFVRVIFRPPGADTETTLCRRHLISAPLLKRRKPPHAVNPLLAKSRERSTPSGCDEVFLCAKLRRMMISLSPEQQAWISAWLARGDFASAKEAAHQVIDERSAERVMEEQNERA